MKRFLFSLLLLWASLAQAQVITELPSWPIYPGNPAQRLLILPTQDSAKVVTATLYYDRNGRVYAPAYQPSISTSGRRVVIGWPVTTALEATGYLKIRIGSVIRFGVPITVSPKNVVITDPKALTVTYPNDLMVLYSPPPPVPPVTALSIWQQLMTLLFNP